ncbi:hypothetical protein SAMN05216553_106240 [Lentzea fradiae]|uniref:Schlafen group 3-like DNA/RNA helicase domain-containing protein n=1 Tax=Lentzea fradiae TaxID=200378 RepID=A0A1G7SG30_9PSEU|nr:hypothetical protein SAMN05216553_106240 [Lentzea fradiae]
MVTLSNSGGLVPLVQDKAAHLLQESRQNTLHSRLGKAYSATHFKAFSAAEYRSWQHSLKALLEVLDEAGLHESHVLLEHSLPRSSLRVDAIVCGLRPDTGRPSYVFVELKQWSRVHSVEGCLVRQHENDEPRLHPADQVRDYCRYVAHSLQFVAEEKELVNGLAYLHNANRRDIRALERHTADRWGRMYTKDDRSELVRDLTLLLDGERRHEENRAAAERFLKYPARPSAQFVEIAKNAVGQRELLPLVDQQMTAYQLVKTALTNANEGSRKKVVIVVGGPGSGKSAIAVSLLGSLEELDLRGYHATGSKSFTETLRTHLDPRRRTGVWHLFKYNNDFRENRNHGVDVIVSDEAHRLRRSSTSPGTRRSDENAVPQIAELITAARVPVFLLDDNQRVRADEVGSVAEITRIAHELGCEVEKINLRGQFRCGGSATFDHWVDRLLGIVDEPPVVWSDLVQDDRFEVHVGDSPRDMENWFRARRTQEQTARMTAGFCWDWPYDHRSKTPDIVIGDWRRWWNLRKEAADGPASTFWATDPRGARQVGCVYTAQGFEYDWAGVIFGPDLVWREGGWVARRDRSRDGKAKADPALFPELVRNAYRVLLTRGMRGVTMFSVDPRTQEHLRTMVGPQRT